MICLKTKNNILFYRLFFAVCLLSFLNLHAEEKVVEKKDSLVVVCFGNSTTAARKNIEKVYPLRLQEALDKKQLAYKVINAGIPGSHAASIKDNATHKVAHGMDRFETAIMDNKPNWVIISFGINDSWQDKGIYSPSRISLERFRESLLHFIIKLKSTKSKIILMGPNPLGKKYEAFRKERLKLYEVQCKKIARKNNIYWIDTRKIFFKSSKNHPNGIDELLLDGMHPNDKGHELISTAIFKIITKKQLS